MRERNVRGLLLWAVAACPLALAGCGGNDVAEHPGKKTYERYCFSCHHAGVAGAPKFGDPEGWDWRLKKGREALLDSVVAGMPPAMPAKGLCNVCDEQRLADALDYLLGSLEG